MKKNLIQSVFINILVLGYLPFFLPACIDEDISNISDSAVLSQVYSIPLGVVGSSADDFIQNFDTSGTGDPYYFYYNDSLQIDRDGTFNFSEYLAVDFSNLVGATSIIKAAMLRFNMYNRTAGSVNVQVYLLNDASVVSDSLFDNPVHIEPGHTNAEGRVEDYSYNRAEVFYTADEWSQILNIRTVLINGEVLLSQNDTLKFYSSDSVKFQFALRVYLEENPTYFH